MRITIINQAKKFNILNKLGELSKTYGNFPDSYVKRAAEQVYWYLIFFLNNNHAFPF